MQRIGLIGAGDISKYHIAAWRSVRDAELVAVCDIDAKRAEARADEYGGTRVYTDAAEMLARESLTAVDIATWRATHSGLTRLAAAHGVHVLCQKPLADTFAEAAALTVEVADRIRVMVNENRRFAPQYRQIRAWLDDGVLGDVHQATVTNYNSSLVLRADGTRAGVQRAVHFGRERRLVIAGALTHQVDVLHYLLSTLQLVAARALRTETDVPGETVATLFLTTAAGAPVIVNGNSVAPGYLDAPAARVGSSGIAGDRLEIIGSRASCLLYEDTLRLYGAVTETREYVHKQWYQACFDGAAAHFVQCLETGTPFEASAEVNLKTLEIVESAYRSAGLT